MSASTSGPYIYDFQNHLVRNIEIHATMQGWTLGDAAAAENESKGTLITIKKMIEEDGRIEIRALYDYGNRDEAAFANTVTNPSHIVNLSFPNENMVLMSWEYPTNYIVEQWYIPVRDILLVSINKS